MSVRQLNVTFWKMETSWEFCTSPIQYWMTRDINSPLVSHWFLFTMAIFRGGASSWPPVMGRKQKSKVNDLAVQGNLVKQNIPKLTGKSCNLKTSKGKLRSQPGYMICFVNCTHCVRQVGHLASEVVLNLIRTKCLLVPLIWCWVVLSACTRQNVDSINSYSFAYEIVCNSQQRSSVIVRNSSDFYQLLPNWYLNCKFSRKKFISSDHHTYGI